MKSFLDYYIPTQLDDLILPNNFINFLYKCVNKDQLYLLLQGVEGKSTLIKCLLNEQYKKCNANMDYSTWSSNYVLSLNHWNENINSWRKKIVSFCKMNDTQRKIIIIDGLELISQSFQCILYNTIETYRNKIFFIGTCKNYSHIYQSLKSILHIIPIPKISCSQMEKLFNKIQNEHQLNITDEFKEKIIHHSKDVKEMILILEKIKLLNHTTFTLDELIINIKYEDFHKYTKLCIENNDKSIYNITNILYNYVHKGFSVIDILEEYYKYIQWDTTLNENIKYKIIKIIMKYIGLFHTVHEHTIELYFFTYDLIKTISDIESK